jgi:hypothetical protein
MSPVTYEPLAVEKYEYFCFYKNCKFSWHILSFKTWTENHIVEYFSVFLLFITHATYCCSGIPVVEKGCHSDFAMVREWDTHPWIYMDYQQKGTFCDTHMATLITCWQRIQNSVVLEYGLFFSLLKSWVTQNSITIKTSEYGNENIFYSSVAFNYIEQLRHSSILY